MTKNKNIGIMKKKIRKTQTIKEYMLSTCTKKNIKNRIIEKITNTEIVYGISSESR